MSDTAQILVKLTWAQREQVKAAAKRMGVKMGAFCAQAILEAVDRAGGEADLDSTRMLAAVYQKICVDIVVAPRVAEAVDALVQMGEDEKKALKRITKLAMANPDATAEVLLAEALKRKV